MELFVIWDWPGKQVTLLWFSSFPATALDYKQLKVEESVFSTITFTDKFFFSYHRAVGELELNRL